jgi:hypothetical protein
MIRLSVIFVLAVILTTKTTFAQSFFGGGVVAYDPEISVVNSGAVTDVQATVSSDRKYVTITMQATDSRLLALKPFQVTTPLTQQGGKSTNQGFVGAVNPSNTVSTPSSGTAINSTTTGLNDTAEEIDRRAIAARSILSKPGMFLLHAD